jgi:hypothetical protein
VSGHTPWAETKRRKAQLDVARALRAATTDAEFTTVLVGVPWYVVPDDLVGGWAIATADLPTSRLPGPNGERMIGDALTRGLAEHVVALHNRALRQADDTRFDALGDDEETT